jgi:hypothetical protein
MPRPQPEHYGGPWTALKIRGPLEHGRSGRGGGGALVLTRRHGWRAQ